MKKKLFLETSWVLFFLVLFVLIKSSFLGVSLISSPSMLPSIVSGDRVVTNKLAYGLHLPFFTTPVVHWDFPKRGDVILFHVANHEELYIKRVIGIAGDLVSFRSGTLFINGIAVLQIKSDAFSEFKESQLIEEKISSSSFSYPILLSKTPDRTFFEERRFLVPTGKLFVLGDNRDNSFDSRSFGYVSASGVIGKAALILFSTTGEGSFLPQFRANRFLRPVP